MFEAHLFYLVGVRPWNAVVADFNQTHHSHLHALLLHGHKRLDVELDIIGDEDIGTKERKPGPFDVVFQTHDFAIPFVVADGAKVETRLVHQLNHRVIDGVILVVDGVARAIVACRKEQQVGVNGSQTVDQRGKLGELVNAGVHVVDRKDGDFRLASGDGCLPLLGFCCFALGLIAK